MVCMLQQEEYEHNQAACTGFDTNNELLQSAFPPAGMMDGHARNQVLLIDTYKRVQAH